MLIFRRNYMTTRLPQITNSHAGHISVGQYLQATNRSCPKRNHLLGENFCRFAVKLKVYIDAANNVEPFDSNALHKRYLDAVGRLSEPKENESNRLKLPSTGQFLPEIMFKKLNTWKQNCHDEVLSLDPKLRNSNDDAIMETVRGINYSLIGWYLQTYGMQNALAFIQWLGLPLFSNSDDFRWAQPKSPLRTERNRDTQSKLNGFLDGYDNFEQKLSYKFQDKTYLLQSVTHESFTSNDLTPSYKGLDFVGDAVLNYAIVRHLFRHPANLSAYQLRSISSLLYCNSSLATVSMRNGFHKYLRYTEPSIRDNINSFEAFLRRNKFKPVNDLYFLDRKNFIFEVPPIVPSSFEALVGAIYFDAAMDLNVVSNKILGLMHWDIKTMCESKPRTAYDELDRLDPLAIFSEPENVASGQIKVTVTLPKFQGQRFSGLSRDAQLAKWGAAKMAVNELNKLTNVFIPVKQKELLDHYAKFQPPNTLKQTE